MNEIPWDEFFGTVGLRVLRHSATLADPGFMAARNFDASPSVLRVQAGSVAERSGLMAGDVLLEMNGHVVASDFLKKLEQLRPGEVIHLKIRHHDSVREVQWQVGAREEVEFAVKDVENVTTQQRARRAAWLRGESQPAGDSRP